MHGAHGGDGFHRQSTYTVNQHNKAGDRAHRSDVFYRWQCCARKAAAGAARKADVVGGGAAGYRALPEAL
jgi:hypothetical protein